MAYDPAVHGRLDSLYVTYRDRLLSEARSDAPQASSPSAGPDLSEAYADALATAHAVYAYLAANPPGRSSALDGEAVDQVAVLPDRASLEAIVVDEQIDIVQH